MATGQKSSTVFNRIANYNDSGPSFNCFLQEEIINAGVKWEKQGSNVLPFGISRPSSQLVWNRPLDFRDTGVYVCTYSDKHATMLRLAVKRKYNVTLGK